jgi:hypothetical protein
MSNPNLNALEIRDLINRYKSELRKLDFQVEKTQGTIADLEAQLGERLRYEDMEASAAPEAVAQQTTPPAKKRGRPRKPEKAASNGAKPKKKAASGSRKKSGPAARAPIGPKPMKRKRKLSEWDEFVLDTLKKSNTALISSELLDKAEKKNKRKSGSDKLTDIQLKRKLNQVLHKLANKRGAIVKTQYEGKGFAYGLPEWYDDDGHLKSEFQRQD